MAEATALHNNWREGSLNLATLDIDRFAGYVPDDEGESARVETSPLLLSDEILSINAEIEPGGSIRAMLMDAGGAEVSGFGFADCLPLKQGGIGCELRWREHDMCLSLRGKTLRLVFEFQKAKLYALKSIADRVSD